MFIRAIKPLLPLIPIGLICVILCTAAVATYRSRRGANRRSAWSSSGLDVLLGAAVVGVLVLTLPPSIDAGRSIEVIPFRRIWHYSTARAEMVANIILFIPLGALAPARWKALDRWGLLLIFAIALSVAIEVAQFALDLGRQASSTDIILNVSGAALGYLVLRIARVLMRDRTLSVDPGGRDRIPDLARRDRR